MARAAPGETTSEDTRLEIERFSVRAAMPRLRGGRLRLESSRCGWASGPSMRCARSRSRRPAPLDALALSEREQATRAASWPRSASGSASCRTWASSTSRSTAAGTLSGGEGSGSAWRPRSDRAWSAPTSSTSRRSASTSGTVASTPSCGSATSATRSWSSSTRDNPGRRPRDDPARAPASWAASRRHRHARGDHGRPEVADGVTSRELSIPVPASPRRHR